LEIYLLPVILLASPEVRCLMELARESTSKFCCKIELGYVMRDWTFYTYLKGREDGQRPEFLNQWKF